MHQSIRDDSGSHVSLVCIVCGDRAHADTMVGSLDTGVEGEAVQPVCGHPGQAFASCCFAEYLSSAKYLGVHGVYHPLRLTRAGELVAADPAFHYTVHRAFKGNLLARPGGEPSLSGEQKSFLKKRQFDGKCSV